MGIIVQLALLAGVIAAVAIAVKIHRRLGRLDTSLGKLLAFFDGAQTEVRKDLQEERNAWGAFRKTTVDVLMGSRSSIDAIRSVMDELSAHRRDTMEMQRPVALPVLDSGRQRPPPASAATETTRRQEAPSISRRRVAVQIPAVSAASASPGFNVDQLGDRDSSESTATRVMSKPTAAELETGALRLPAGEAEQRAAGLVRPRSQRPLPPVTPPPVARSRIAPTLPSMQAAEPLLEKKT